MAPIRKRDLIKFMIAFNELESNTSVLTFPKIQTNCESRYMQYVKWWYLYSSVERFKRMNYLHPKTPLPSETDSEFHRTFGMSRETFQQLKTFLLVESKFRKPYVKGQKPIEFERKLQITLSYLANECTMEAVAFKFESCEGTVLRCVEEVTDALCRRSSEVILWPNINACEKISKLFEERASFPGVIGAIHRCLIEVRAPGFYQTDSTNEESHCSIIILQGVCTTDNIFTNVAVSYEGTVELVFHASQLKRTVDECGQLYLFHTEDYHIVGSVLYPLEKWLMVPFRNNGELTKSQQKFNESLDITREPIQHTFELLKSRWRRINCMNIKKLDKAIRIVLACCVLHNFCLMYNDHLTDSEPSSSGSEEVNYSCLELDEVAKEKRQRIVDEYFERESLP